jgi:acetate kinase
VFTGGIGENSTNVRARTVGHLQLLGFSLDDNHNREHGHNSNHEISDNQSRFPVLVIPTDEERVIAGEALKSADSE